MDGLVVGGEVGLVGNVLSAESVGCLGVWLLFLVVLFNLGFQVAGVDLEQGVTVCRVCHCVLDLS